jgi:hypothetical protein
VVQQYRDPYTALLWYCFCRRTGHGDLSAARTAFKTLFDSKNGATAFRILGVYFYILDKKPEQALKLATLELDRTADLHVGLHVALLHDELKDAKSRDAVLQRVIEQAAKVKPTKENASRAVVVQLAKWMVADLAAGGKAETDRTATDKANDELKAGLRQKARPNDKDAIAFDYFLGRYLSLHGKPDEAVKYWKKCVAETERFDSIPRSFAGAELCDRNIKPESYKSLWEKPQAEAKPAK